MGEINALSTDDVDLENRKVYVHQTISSDEYNNPKNTYDDRQRILNQLTQVCFGKERYKSTETNPLPLKKD